MKIKNIKLEEFKRFKSLEIADLPESAKLVMLIGPNGCGKSSLFDGMLSWAEWKGRTRLHHARYYARTKDLDDSAVLDKTKIVFFGDTQPSSADDYKKAVYVRTAHRNTPSLQVGHHHSSMLEEQRITYLSDDDSATNANYHYAIDQLLDRLQNFGQLTGDEITGAVIDPIKTGIQELFPTLFFQQILLPNAGGDFSFDKGKITGFSYAHLSSGEKAGFDLIFDLSVKRKEFDDTVFCIDEPEAHINPAIQGKLLRVLYDLIPDNCQLWLATHSIGMMREAYNLQKEQPEQVVFLDFDKNQNGRKRNFDMPEKITPAAMTRSLWERSHEIVLGDLSDLVAPEVLCLCESSEEKEFDADCYTTIFQSEFPDVQFISVGGKKEVKKQAKKVSYMFKKVMPEVKIIGVVDSDAMTPSGKEKHRSEGLIRPLSRQCIEWYLLDDEVLDALCHEHLNGDKNLLAELKKIRKQNSNNIKKAASLVYKHAKQANSTAAIGSDLEEFEKHTLAPLIKPGMEVYKELKQDIFGGPSHSPAQVTSH